MTLESFGRKTTEHVQQLFSKKGVDGGNANVKEGKRRSIFTGIKLERSEKVPEISDSQTETTVLEIVKEDK